MKNMIDSEKKTDRIDKESKANIPNLPGKETKK